MALKFLKAYPHYGFFYIFNVLLKYINILVLKYMADNMLFTVRKK